MGPLAQRLIVLGALAMPAVATAQILVPNSNVARVTSYSEDAAGNTAPSTLLEGVATELSFPFALAIDPVAKEIYVANLSSHAITIYPLTATGNVAPTRKIEGPATGLVSPIGLRIDRANSELVVRNFGGTTILVFALGASGNVAPLRVLAGAATTIATDTADLFVDAVNDELVVPNRTTPGEILFFARTASGDTAPSRKISGPATLLDRPYGVHVDLANDEIFVASASPGAVHVFSRTAQGNVAPLRTLSGPTSGVAGATGVAVKGEELFVANQSFNEILVFQRTASGDPAPLRTLSGIATQLSSPTLLKIVPPLIFSDGFESGNTSAWSLAVP